MQRPKAHLVLFKSREALSSQIDKMLFWHFLKLQKCFMDYETSPDIPAARRWGDDWTFTFRWTAPLI